MTPASLLRHHLATLGYRAWEHDGGVSGDGWRVVLTPEGPVVEGPEPLRWAVEAWWVGLGDEGRADA